MAREDGLVFRRDLPSIHADQDRLIKFNKTFSEFNRRAKEFAKPSNCYICGNNLSSPCNSHTIPRYCLQEIAIGGKILTSSYLVGTNLQKSEVGVGEAALFKNVCKKCDSEFFKRYETPETLLELPDTQVMGQIASKNLLREIDKARQLIGFNKALNNPSAVFIDSVSSVREMDLGEDEKSFKASVMAGKNKTSSNIYKLIFHEVLPYTAPMAFQQMISPLSDFEGCVINNLFNPNPKYKIEPLHVCVFPSKGNTVLMLFTNSKTKRYRAFTRQFSSLSTPEKHLAILKLIFAYSEDVFLSKHLDEEILNDPALKALAQMNTVYLSFGDHGMSYKKSVHSVALKEFAIDNLPDPPNLLSREYAIQV